MKLTSQTLAFGLALAALVTIPLALSAVAGPQKPEPRQEGKPHHEDGGLEGAMQTLNGGMKRLGKALDKPDLDAVAKTAVEMQKAALAAKLETPHTADLVSDAKEKAAFLVGYRKQIIALERALLDLETAALDGKGDDAKKIYNDTLGSLKKTGHDQYKKD